MKAEPFCFYRSKTVSIKALQSPTDQPLVVVVHLREEDKGIVVVVVKH